MGAGGRITAPPAPPSPTAGSLPKGPFLWSPQKGGTHPEVPCGGRSSVTPPCGGARSILFRAFVSRPRRRLKQHQHCRIFLKSCPFDAITIAV